MENEVTSRWIEAGEAIATDPGAEVICPVCQKIFLQVTDVRNEKNLSELERHMICKECGAYNALRMTSPVGLDPSKCKIANGAPITSHTRLGQACGSLTSEGILIVRPSGGK